MSSGDQVRISGGDATQNALPISIHDVLDRLHELIRSTAWVEFKASRKAQQKQERRPDI